MLREEHVQRSGGEDMTHLRKWEQVGVIETAVRSWIIKGLIKREKELGILPVACNIYKRGNSMLRYNWHKANVLFILLFHLL